MKKKIIVIGSGISGLTVCYELSKFNNFDIDVYDMKSNIGGLAKSFRYKDNKPTEHSWRLFNKNYYNLFNIMKNITDNNNTIYNNLNFKKPIIHKVNLTNILNTNIIYILFYYIYYLSYGNKRSKNQLSSKKIINYIKSKELFQQLLYIGPDPKLISIYSTKNAYLYFSNIWYHLNKPTSEAIFIPWINHIKKNNVKIFLNHKLTKINYKNNQINSIIFNNKIQKKADYYVLALPPYGLYPLFQNLIIQNSLKNQIKELHYKGLHKELSFRFYFTDYIKLDNQIDLSYTDWGIVFIPTHSYWNKEVNLGKNIKSIFSGTCITGYDKSSRTNKNIFESSLNEVKLEIKYQLENNVKLNNILAKNNNGKKLADYKYKIEIWKEWFDTKNGCDTKDIYWANTFQTAEYRLDQDIGLKNTYFCGVHTKTSIDIATMESACESGKLVSMKILEKENIKNNIYYHKHEPSKLLKYIYKIDDLLYDFNMPNILDLLIILIICSILIYI